MSESELPLLTNSRMRCFRECARKHRFSYVEGWRPAIEPEALRFGSLVHIGLEGYWLAIGRSGSDPLGAAFGSIADRGTDAFDQARAEEILRGYAMRWSEEDAATYDVIAVEPQYRTPLWNVATDRDSRTWQLAGKIDAILRRRADQRVLVCEHKTTVSAIESDAEHYWSTLALDHQISGYVLGAEALGHRVDEVLYDVLRKPQQRPLLATPVEARKWTKDGRLYANQRETDETADEYRLRLREAIMSDLSRYFQRRAIPRTESQIRDYLADAWATASIMRTLELENLAPRNPEACWRFGACPYWSLCSTGAKPEESPGEFVHVSNVNTELEDR